MFNRKTKRIKELEDKLDKLQKEYNDLSKKYEDLKYNIKTFYDPNLLKIKKIKLLTTNFAIGKRDNMKKAILTNLDTIVDNIFVDDSLFIGRACNLYIMLKDNEEELKL